MREVNPREPVFPLMGGIEIVNLDAGKIKGTLGFIFQFEGNDLEYYGITTQHSLIPDVVSGYIFHPYHRHEQSRKIGEIDEYTLIDEDLDYAVFKLSSDIGPLDIDAFQSINGINGLVVSMTKPEPDMHVMKFGRTTEYTSGVVKLQDDDTYFDVISVDGTNLSEEGDSGCLWVTKTADGLSVVGLHIEGNGINAKATNFSMIYEALALEGLKVNFNSNQIII